jgi:hypothetical protein
VALAGELVGKRRAEETRGSSDEKIHSGKIIALRKKRIAIILPLIFD